MKSSSARKVEDFFTYRRTEFLDTLDISLEISAVEYEQDTARRRRLLGSAQSAVEPAIVKARIVRSPLFKRPTEQSRKKLPRLADVGDRDFDVIDSSFFTHCVLSLRPLEPHQWPLGIDTDNTKLAIDFITPVRKTAQAFDRAVAQLADYKH